MVWLSGKARKAARDREEAIYRELQMIRFEVHQILRHISGEPLEIRFLNKEERQHCAMELRYQYRGVPEDSLPDSVKARLELLESSSLVGYGDLSDQAEHSDAKGSDHHGDVS